MKNCTIFRSRESEKIIFINNSNIIINCQDGNLYQLNFKNKKSEIIASSGQEYGSWDFVHNSKTNKIILDPQIPLMVMH